MYAALWRGLPGPWWVRVLILAVLAAAVLYGLLFHAFPWISQFVNPQEVTVALGVTGPDAAAARAAA